MHRTYDRDRDFERVGAFLDRHHQPWNADGNWLQPAWEYMHFHPALDTAIFDACAVWESAGEIVGVVHAEWNFGEAFFQVRPDLPELRIEMLDHAERALRGTGAAGRPYLHAYALNTDHALQAELARRGYERHPDEDRPLTGMTIAADLPVTVPPGYRVQSLADENDLAKIDRCLWRGFNHEGEPDGDLTGRKIMQSGPGFRHDLTIVVVAGSGEYVAFSGSWHDEANHFSYIEPVATDPDHRRLGLGRAAVCEGLRRCASEGATIGYVGSNQPFYGALGFRPVNVEQCWVRRW
jgi:predicted N-acetyltransferase YhbS